MKRVVADLALDNTILKEGCPGKLLSPSKRRTAIIRVKEKLGVSERRACKALEQCRLTQGYVSHSREKEKLVARIIELATQYDR